MTNFDITDFGALGDGRTLDTRPIQQAANACRQAGGGIVRVPAGIFVTGTFELYSNTTLQVEKGATLLASPRLEDHLVGEASVGLLHARDAHDIVLTGGGTIDGNAPAFFDGDMLHGGNEDFTGHDTWQRRRGLPYGTREIVHGPLGSPSRPGNMVIIARCQDVRIENLTFTGAAYWTIHCADCTDLVVENIKVSNDPRHPNNDGLHLTTCRRARIRGCQIVAGDDAIAITGFRDAGHEPQIAYGLSGMVAVSEDIEVTDCLLSSRSTALRIGYGPNPVCRVRVSRLRIENSNRGIGICARQADVEDVLIEDCRVQTSIYHGNWWGRGEPIHFSTVGFPDERQVFHIRDVVLRDINATGENAVTLFAQEAGAIDNVRMVRVKFQLKLGDLFEQWGGNLDLRPAADPRLTTFAGGTAPLWAIGVSRLACEDCQWHLDADTAHYFSPEPFIQDTPSWT